MNELWFFSPKGKITGEDVNKYLLKTNSGVVLRAEEQDAVWAELDNLNSKEIQIHDGNSSTPPSPSDFASWFDTNNSVDLRSLLRDIEIVFIEAAMNRNNGNTSEAAKDLKLLRTTLIEKVRKYGL